MSEFQKFLSVVIIILWLILAAVTSARIGQKRGYNRGYSDALASIKPDTVTVIDTLREEVPVEVIKWKDKEKPVYIPVHDTTTIHDSTYIVLPREFKQYKKETYSLQISGVDPELDWIETYTKTEYITKVVPEYKNPTFMLSPALEAFVLPGSYGVGAGLELDYWIGRWEFSGGGGYSLQAKAEETVTGPYGAFKVKYNLIRK